MSFGEQVMSILKSLLYGLIGLVLIVVALVLAASSIAAATIRNEYYFYAAYVVIQFVVLATAWNILGGYAGYVNFGSSAAGHSTQLTLGGGFRSHLTKNIDFGFSYEKAVSKPYGLLDDRYTFDLVFHF